MNAHARAPCLLFMPAGIYYFHPHYQRQCARPTVKMADRSLSSKKHALANLDSSRKRRARNAQFTISQRDFAKRVRFVDSAGYKYAVPLVSDSLYEQYVKTGMVDFNAPTADTLPQDGEAPLDTTTVMLYFRKPRTRELKVLPTADVTLFDMETHRVFEARVSLVVSSQMNKPGHMLLENLVDTGRIGNAADFK